MFKLFSSAALVVAFIVSAAALAPAQNVSERRAGVPGDKPIAGLTLDSTQPVVAKIAAIDPSGATVTLTTPKGGTVTRNVSALVRNLGQLKTGDTVAVVYKQRLTFVASEPNAATPAPAATKAELLVRDPALPIKAAVIDATRSYYVVSADPAARTISIVDTQGGPVHTLSVSDEVAQAQLPLVKPGYKLTIYDLETVVAAIAKQAA
jgi:hypothetical protein